jgi:polar amino acid transport system substrate-binding protein
MRAGARYRGAVGCLVAVAGVAATGCGSGSGGAPPEGATKAKASIAAPADVAKSGRLSFCTDATFPPFEFKQGSETVGADVEIGQQIAARMGVRAEFAQTGFDAIIAALRSGRCDAIIAGMTVSPERERQVDFVRYVRSGQSIMLKADSTAPIQSVEDLAGRSVGVQTGSVHGQRLKALSSTLVADGKRAIDVVAFPGNTEAASALRANRIDAFVSDYPQLAYLARQAPDDFKVVGAQTDVEPLGIAVAKDDAELRDAISKAVGAAYRDGAMKAILRRWRVPQMALPVGQRPS